MAQQPDAYRDVADTLCADPAMSEGQMMGMPALKLGNKMIGGCFDGDLLVKLGRERVDELVAAGRAQPFDPSERGRPMKDWALVPEPADDWLELAEEAKERQAGQ